MRISKRHRDIALLAFPILAVAACDSKPVTPLNAVVVHTGVTFTIHNKDPYNWGDCDLDLNSEYSVNVASIPAGDSIKVPAPSFAKKDGTRFNFLATKPMKLFIYCRDTQFGTRSTLVGWN